VSGAVRVYCPLAKGGKHQKCQGLDVLDIFRVLLSGTSYANFSFIKRGKAQFFVLCVLAIFSVI